MGDIFEGWQPSEVVAALAVVATVLSALIAVLGTLLAPKIGTRRRERREDRDRWAPQRHDGYHLALMRVLTARSELNQSATLLLFAIDGTQHDKLMRYYDRREQAIKAVNEVYVSVNDLRLIGTGPVWIRLFAIHSQLVSILVTLPKQEQAMPPRITAKSLQPGVFGGLDRLKDAGIPNLTPK